MLTGASSKSLTFISYAHEDLRWAEKVVNTLEHKGFDFFFDKHSLRAGDDWVDKIESNLQKSSHLIILWSKKAIQSAWVTREITRFLDAKESEPNKTIVPIMLEKITFTWDTYQLINDIADAGIYDQISKTVESRLWQAVENKIEKAIGDDLISIPVALLTMTKDDARALKLDATFYGPTLRDTLKKFGVDVQLDRYYGAAREDWKPFGGEETIWTVLDALKDEIRQKTGLPRFRWELIGEGFWCGDDNLIKKEAKRLTSTLSVVVIDPLSLYHKTVQYCLFSISKAFSNSKAIIMILMPFSKPEPYVGLRDQINRIPGIREYFYEPWEVPSDSMAYCEFQIDDPYAVKTFLIKAIKSHIKSKPPGTLYLRI